MKFMPESTAACSARLDSPSSTGPNTPPMVMAPKPMTVTSRPVRPSVLFSMIFSINRRPNSNNPAGNFRKTPNRFRKTVIAWMRLMAAAS